ncbi:hypothetical protein VJ918_10565 [Adlercreutzia sp. R21]|uniref:CdiA C-terminal domain-containing protein n=1 Tax=Adlercreutzia wanghongyangiae TaxID=3111451 RepID=UPI002DBB9DD2|nr:hypothetical protein [Adlercreutzia sp. R21]MEC4185252.1 hypothetical protein [Adlercreutzia sp. R21]
MQLKTSRGDTRLPWSQTARCLAPVQTASNIENCRAIHLTQSAARRWSSIPYNEKRYYAIITPMSHHQGNIVAPSHLNILQHEMDAARAIADYGMDVEFMAQIKGNRAKSADFVAGGVLWEVKSPTSNKLKVVEKHLRGAAHQSHDIIFDCRRMKGLREEAIYNEAAKWAKVLTSVRRLLFISRSGKVTQIK